MRGSCLRAACGVPLVSWLLLTILVAVCLGVVLSLCVVGLELVWLLAFVEVAACVGFVVLDNSWLSCSV